MLNHLLFLLVFIFVVVSLVLLKNSKVFGKMNRLLFSDIKF